MLLVFGLRFLDQRRTFRATQKRIETMLVKAISARIVSRVLQDFQAPPDSSLGLSHLQYDIQKLVDTEGQASPSPTLEVVYDVTKGLQPANFGHY